MTLRTRVPASVWGLLGLAVGYGTYAALREGPGEWPRIAAPDLAASLAGASSPLVLDVRTPQEYANGHVPGARNVYFRDLPRRVDELAAPRDAPIVVYCETGARSRAAIRALQAAGFSQVMQLEGDMGGWRRGGLPQARVSGPGPGAPGG